MHLEDDHMCFVCGQKNEQGLRMSFRHPAPGRLEAEIVLPKTFQGFKDIVHGGVMSMLLDEMMVNLAWKEGKAAVTGRLEVRLRQPARVGEKILLEGCLDGEDARTLTMSAVAKRSSGEILATGKALCMRIKPS